MSSLEEGHEYRYQRYNDGILGSCPSVGAQYSQAQQNYYPYKDNEILFLEDAVTDLQHSVKHMQSELKALKSNNQPKVFKKKEKMKLMNEFNTAIQENKDFIRECKKGNEKLEIEIKHLKEILGLSNFDLVSMKSEPDEKEAYNKFKDKVMQTFKKELKKEQKKIQSRIDKIDQAWNNSKNLATELKKEKQRNSVLEKKIDELEHKLEDLLILSENLGHSNIQMNNFRDSSSTSSVSNCMKGVPEHGTVHSFDSISTTSSSCQGEFYETPSKRARPSQRYQPVLKGGCKFGSEEPLPTAASVNCNVNSSSQMTTINHMSQRESLRHQHMNYNSTRETVRSDTMTYLEKAHEYLQKLQSSDVFNHLEQENVVKIKTGETRNTGMFLFVLYYFG